MPDVDISKRPAIFLYNAVYNGKQDTRPKFSWGLTPDEAMARAKKAEDAAMKLRPPKTPIRQLGIALLGSAPFDLETKIFEHPEMLEYRAALGRWEQQQLAAMAADQAS